MEKVDKIIENVGMKKTIAILAIVVLFCSNPTSLVFSEEFDNTETAQVEVSNVQEEEMFAPVDLDLTDYTNMNKQNKKFKLSAEKEGKPSYVKNTGQIWDEDKLFRYNYYSNETNLRVIPSYGSLGAYVSRDLDANTKVMVGQDGLSSMHGDTINFFYTNGSYYSSGARLEGKTAHFDYMVGAATNTDTYNNDIAAAISTKPKHLLGSKGTFSFGGGVYSNILSGDTKNTAGLFSQYKQGKFSLGTQIAQSSYENGSKAQSGAIHLLPKYTINDHLSLKSKIVKDLDVEEIQGEVGINFRPLKDTDVLSFELSATNYQSQNTITRQKLKFTTQIKF